MDPDMDALFFNEDEHVIERIEDAPRQALTCLIVSDSDTYPGYIKLQLVIDGIALTADIIDKSNYWKNSQPWIGLES